MRKMPVTTLLEVRADARERMARAVFDINRVSELMAEAAGTGRWHARHARVAP